MIGTADNRCFEEGLRGVSVARNIPRHTREIISGLTLTAQYAFDPYLDSSNYLKSRGWTCVYFALCVTIYGLTKLQISGRTVCLENARIYQWPRMFSLHKSSVFRSCLLRYNLESRPALKYPDTKRRLIGRKETSLSMPYFRAVETYYTARSFTYSSDINAPAGVLNTQGNVMNCGIFQVLPSAIFDLALLWQPRGKVIRREGFPSWSWAGWQAQVMAIRWNWIHMNCMNLQKKWNARK